MSFKEKCVQIISFFDTHSGSIFADIERSTFGVLWRPFLWVRSRLLQKTCMAVFVEGWIPTTPKKQALSACLGCWAWASAPSRSNSRHGVCVVLSVGAGKSHRASGLNVGCFDVAPYEAKGKRPCITELFC